MIAQFTDTQTTYTLNVSIPRITERRLYFIKQKLFGVSFILLGVAASIILQSIAAFIILALMGSAVIGTKEMVLTNTYFLNHRR